MAKSNDSSDNSIPNPLRFSGYSVAGPAHALQEDLELALKFIVQLLNIKGYSTEHVKAIETDLNSIHIKLIELKNPKHKPELQSEISQIMEKIEKNVAEFTRLIEESHPQDIQMQQLARECASEIQKRLRYLEDDVGKGIRADNRRRPHY